MSTDSRSATADLEYVRRVIERTQARVDPHAFHFVLWGTLVLVVYPLLNWLGTAAPDWSLPIGVAALVIGASGSTFLEWRLKAGPRVAGENTFVARQVVLIVYPVLGAAVLLSVIGPASGAIPGPYVAVVWGFAYAVMAFMVGVVYTGEYLVAGAAIFAGSVIALLHVEVAGYVLGPCMGLGMIVPGLMAERRVARMRAEDDADGERPPEAEGAAGR